MTYFEERRGEDIFLMFDDVDVREKYIFVVDGEQNLSHCREILGVKNIFVIDVDDDVNKSCRKLNCKFYFR